MRLAKATFLVATFLLSHASRFVYGQTQEEFFEDFEEKVIDPIPFYPNWEAVQLEGYPSYNVREIRRAQGPNAYSGRGFLRLLTLGGKVAVQTQPGLIGGRRSKFTRPRFLSVESGRLYTVTVRARLQGTRDNIGYASLRWLDERGILVREDRTTAVAKPGEWAELSKTVFMTDERSVYLQIRLSFEGLDVKGECGFDAIRIISRPKVLIHPDDREFPLFEQEPARLKFDAPWLKSGSCAVEWSVIDDAEQIVLPVSTTTLDAGRPAAFSVSLKQPGYYEVRYRLASETAGRESDRYPVLIFPPRVYSRDSTSPVGIVLNPYASSYRAIRLWLRHLGVGKVKVVVWDRRGWDSRVEPDPVEILTLMRGLREDRMDLIAELAAPPRTLFGSVEPYFTERGLGPLLASPPVFWEKPLADTVGRFQNYVSRWQIGEDGNEQIARLPAADDIVKGVHERIRSVQTAAVVGVPLFWKEASLSTLKVPEFFALLFAAEDSADTLMTGLDMGGREAHVVVAPGPAEDDRSLASARASLGDLLRRFVLLAAGGKRWDVYIPAEQTLLDEEGLPTCRFFGMRTANDLLGGAIPAALPRIFSDPVREFAFRRGGDLLVAIWSENGVLDREVFLGNGAKAIDVFGRVRSLRAGEVLRIGPEPLFIRGIEEDLIRTQENIRFADPKDLTKPAALSLKEGFVTAAFLLTNKFRSAEMTDVRIRLAPPRGWSIRPPVFSEERLAAGALLRRDLTFSFPTWETVGSKEIPVEVSFTVGSSEYRVKLPRLIGVAPLVRVEPTWLSGPDPKTWKLAVTLYNDSGRRLNLVVSYKVPGEPERSRFVTGLEPSGSTPTPHEFFVPRKYGGVEPIQVTLRETGGQHLFVNQNLPIPP